MQDASTRTVYDWSREEANDPALWAEFLVEMGTEGKHVEITEAMWYYWLECLPPVFMTEHVAYPAGSMDFRFYDFGFAEGAEPVVLFWREGHRFFCMRSDRMNRPW